MNYDILYDGIQRVPYKHQRELLSFAETRPDIVLLWEMGTGKSGGAILVARMHYAKHNRMLRTLIVTPPVTIANWKNEFKLWSKIPNERVHGLEQATGRKKAEYLRARVLPQTDGNVVITNYEALLSEDIFTAIEEWKPELIVFDEAQKLKSHKTKRSRLSQRLSAKASFRITMSGSPLLKDVRDIYGVFRTADNGLTFGKNEALFTFRYLIDENAGWKSSSNNAKYFPKLVNNPKTFEELNQKIFTKAVRKLKSECLDLPPLIPIVETIPLAPDQRKAYNDMVKTYLLFIEDRKKMGEPRAVTANLAIVKALRLLQICTGFVGTDDGTDYMFPTNPRLDRTEELLEELTPNNKVILWCCFTQNVVMLEKLCIKLGLKYVLITGNQTTKQKGEANEIFQSDPEYRVVIANRAAGGVGINLTAASYSIIFSRNFSLEDELQSESRNHRGGSEVHEQIIKIDLVAEDSVEQGVCEALKNKIQVATEVLDMVRR